MKTAHRSRCSNIRGAAFPLVLPMATLERGDMFILIRVFFKAEQSMIGPEMHCKDRENLRDLCPFVEKCLRQAFFSGRSGDYGANDKKPRHSPQRGEAVPWNM